MVTVAETPKFIFRMPADLRAELEQIADREHRTMTNLVVHALREWLSQSEGRGIKTGQPAKRGPGRPRTSPRKPRPMTLDESS